MWFMQNKENEKMKIVKKIANGLLSFLVCLNLVAVFMVFLFSHTLPSKEYILKQMEKCDYYGRIETDLNNGFDAYKYQSGFPDEVFRDLFYKEEVKQDIVSLVNHIYEGTELTNHAENVVEKLAKNIEQHLNENQITLTEQEKNNVEEYKKLMIEVYQEKVIVIPSEYVEKMASGIGKIKPFMGMAEKAVIGTLLILIIVIGVLNFKTIEEGICTLGVGLLSAGTLLELSQLLVTKSIDIKNVLLLSQSLSDFMKKVTFDILSTITGCGIAFILLGLIAIVGGSYRKVKKKEVVENES